MYKLLCQRFIHRNQNILPFTYTYVRQYQTEVKKNVEKSKVSNITKHGFNKYVNYIKSCKCILKRNFPGALHVYNMFRIGTKDLFLEIKKYLLIRKKQITHGIHSLTTEELQLNYRMRKDLIKVCFVFLMSTIPFSNFIVLPAAYYFPKYLLTSHYWTPQQKLDYMLFDQKKRLKHNRPLFKCMQAELHNITNHTLKTKWNDIIACIGSGAHPYVKDVTACSELFIGQPYSLDNLKKKHLKELLAIHNISSWRPFRKQKLIKRGMLIKEMDQAIQREGGITKLSNDSIIWALSFRGVNPTNMSIESMQNWLEQWFVISNTVNESNISLLLHSPILLAYNHPSNLILVYS